MLVLLSPLCSQMKFSAVAFLTLLATATAFVPSQRAMPVARRAAPVVEASKMETEVAKAVPALTALTLAYPAHAEGMSAAFLPPILVPIVGIVFPGLSMALFFIYSQKAQN